MQKLHVLPTIFQNSDGRLKRKSGEQKKFGSDKCQKDGPMSAHLKPSMLQKVIFGRPIAQSWFSKMCFPLERGAHFCKNMKRKCIRAKKLSKMHFATYIFSANSHRDPVPTIILHFARQPLVLFENHKISPRMVLRWPGGMRGAAGGDMRGFEICKM